MDLGSHQIEAIEKLKNGSILCGDVGTGKSRTALAYFYTKVCGGSLIVNGEGSWGEPTSPRDLFIITTAKKRDDLDWLKECVPFALSTDQNISVGGITVTVDSWNNIKKYTKVIGAFFIFDEQRVSGYGSWVKSFLQIARKNQWILLSATPGDTWRDYMPVFIANGFYKNKTDFYAEHCVQNPYYHYKIDRYVNTSLLTKHRNDILVRMEFLKKAEQIHRAIPVEYNKLLYRRVFKDRWDIYDNEPIEETGKLLYLMRKVVNSDFSRIEAVRRIIAGHDKVIIFYNFNYELEMLKMMLDEISILVVDSDGPHTEVFPYSEWNGDKHELIPTGSHWAYLVQYNAGCEGWNCITTNCIIFYSQNYSYRIMAQAAGRIDRMNTPYDALYYYHLKSSAPIDVAIARALHSKKNFNEKAFIGA